MLRLFSLYIIYEMLYVVSQEKYPDIMIPLIQLYTKIFWGWQTRNIFMYPCTYVKFKSNSCLKSVWEKKN